MPVIHNAAGLCAGTVNRDYSTRNYYRGEVHFPADIVREFPALADGIVSRVLTRERAIAWCEDTTRLCNQTIEAIRARRPEGR